MHHSVRPRGLNFESLQALIAECADEAGMPGDPECRSAFVAYIEWGSHLAVINLQPGAQVNGA